MQTLPSQYVFPAPPAELLIFLVAVFVIWAAVRVINDARTWFQEEVLDDHRTPAKNSRKSRLQELLIFLVVLLIASAVVTVINYVRTWY